MTRKQLTSTALKAGRFIFTAGLTVLGWFLRSDGQQPDSSSNKESVQTIDEFLDERAKDLGYVNHTDPWYY